MIKKEGDEAAVQYHSIAPRFLTLFYHFSPLSYPQWKYVSTSFSISSGLSCISARKVLSP